MYNSTIKNNLLEKNYRYVGEPLQNIWFGSHNIDSNRRCIKNVDFFIVNEQKYMVRCYIHNE